MRSPQRPPFKGSRDCGCAALFALAIAGCVPTLPAPEQGEQSTERAATERAIASLPGVRRAAVTTTAAAVTVAATTDEAALRHDIARLAQLAPDAIVIKFEVPTMALRTFGPWTMAASTVWPFTAASVTLLAVIALGAGALAWRLRPLHRRRSDR